MFDVISINEIDYISDNIYVYNIITRFKTEVFGILGKDSIDVTNIEINDNSNENVGETQEESAKRK